MKDFAFNPFTEKDAEVVYIVDIDAIGTERIVVAEKVIYWILQHKYTPASNRMIQFIKAFAGRYEEQVSCANKFDAMLKEFEQTKKIRRTYFVNDKQEARDVMTIIFFINSNIQKLQFCATNGYIY